jgi:4-diphosphocytidyl-2-C-methyl-D-erythritol kinase
VKIISSDKSIPEDDNNLAYIAAMKYLLRFNIFADIEIEITKNIPVGAGLGGGSSDAAATLRALNRAFKCATEDELLILASEIGSDVPFCLVGQTALCRGRGELMESVNSPSHRHIVISIGSSRVSTPKAYGALDKLFGDFSDSCVNDEVKFARESFEKYQSAKADSIPSFNIFEYVVVSSEIDEIKETMRKNAAESVLMSGSGPSVVGSFLSQNDALTAVNALHNLGFEAYMCEYR